MHRRYFALVKRYALDSDYSGEISVGTAIYAVERINKAFLDIKFNANFSSLLYNMLIGIVQHEEKQNKVKII